MKRDALENIVKNAMTDVEVALNTDEIWRGVENKLYPKRKKRFGWFFLGLGLAVVLTAALIFSNSQVQQPLLVENLSTAEEKTSTMSLNSDSASDSEAESQLSDNATRKDEANVVAQYEPTNNNNNIISGESINQIKSGSLDDQLNVKNIKSNSNDKIGYTDISINEDQNNKSILSFVNEESKSIGSSSKIRTHVLFSKLDRYKSNLSFNSFQPINIDLPVLQLPTESISEGLIKNEAQKASWASMLVWHTDLSLGIDKPYRTLTGNNQAYISLRNETERILEGWHAQLLTGVSHKSGFYTSFGLSVSNITEENEVNAKKIVYKLEANPTIDKDKNGQLSIGSSMEKNRYEEIKTGTGYSRHTFYSVPLSIGYQFNISKWTFGAEIGTAFNIIKQSKGYLLNPKKELVSYNTIGGTDDIFLRRVGLHWNTQLRFGYNITEKQQIYMAPYVLLTNQSITLASYQLEQEYQRFGISMGYRYTFN